MFDSRIIWKCSAGWLWSFPNSCDSTRKVTLKIYLMAPVFWMFRPKCIKNGRAKSEEKKSPVFQNSGFLYFFFITPKWNLQLLCPSTGWFVTSRILGFQISSVQKWSFSAFPDISQSMISSRIQNYFNMTDTLEIWHSKRKMHHMYIWLYIFHFLLEVAGFQWACWFTGW